VGDTHCPAGAEADCRAQPGFELRISSVRCGKPLAGPVDQLAVGSDCAIEFQRRGGGGGFCIPDEIDVVRADGSRSIASVPAEDAKGELVACNAPPPHAPVRALLALGPPEGEVMSGKPGKPGESKWRAEERPSSPPALLHVLWNDPGRPGRQVAWLRLD
jgi:hypothetical protein